MYQCKYVKCTDLNIVHNYVNNYLFCHIAIYIYTPFFSMLFVWVL